MKTTKNIWNSFLNNWMRLPVGNEQAFAITSKEAVSSLQTIRARDINIHYGEG
jgi:hypothetical protein